MNVMKQDAMDDKIKERCKTCEKNCMQEGLDRSRSCRVAIKWKPRNLNGSRICRESIGQIEILEKFLNGSRSCQRSVEITKRLDRKDICRGCVKELSSLKKRDFSRREKHIEMNATNKLLKQASKQHVKYSNCTLTLEAKHS